MNTINAPMKHHHVSSPSTHHRLGYPSAGWFSPEPTSVSPSNFILHKVTSNTTRHAWKNLGGLGAGPQVRWALRNGIRKFFSEPVLTKSKTVAVPRRSRFPVTKSVVSLRCNGWPTTYSDFSVSDTFYRSARSSCMSGA